MNADEIIIMLIAQLQGHADGVSQERAIGHAEDYLQEHGWRRDGLTGETWIKD